MRLFAAVYTVAAFAMIPTHLRTDPLPWLGVCATAAVLGAIAISGRHLVMLSAAHAGLTATWAGTLAAAMVKKGYGTRMDTMSLGMLLGLCAGMAVLIAAGMRQRPQPQPVKVKSSRT